MTGRSLPSRIALASMVWASIACAGASCLVSEAMVPRPEFVRVIDSEGDKVMSVVRNPRLDDHQPGPVTPQTVANAMLASGLFADEDAKYLAGPIAAEMPRMGTREQVRVVGWADDGLRVYYALIHGGKLRLAYYKGTEELDRHEAVIPTEAVPMGVAAEPPSLRGPTLGGMASASPAVAPSVAPSTQASPPVAPRAPPPAVAKSAGTPRVGPPPAPLSEEEARKKLRALDEALGKNLITPAEHKRSKREILIRL